MDRESVCGCGDCGNPRMEQATGAKTMITEISNFVGTIREEYHTEGLKPSDGLHVVIDLNKDGKPLKSTYRSFIIKKGKVLELDDHGKLVESDTKWEFAEREYYSGLTDMNKPVDSEKKIHSSVPYTLRFKTKRPSNVPEKEWDRLSKAEKLERAIIPRIKPYYDKLLEPPEIDDKERRLVEQIRDFVQSTLLELLKADKKLDLKDEYGDYVIEDDSYIKVYFNVDKNLLISSYQRYLKDKVFNKNDYNTPDNEYGLSNFLNGANQKKKFVQHQTTFFEVNNRIHYTVAFKLEQFKKLLENKKLPNPVPIFIDQKELNDRVVTLFNREKVLCFRDIIRQLFEERKEDLYNYYLIHWRRRGMDIEINDFDFVPHFRYKLEGFGIKNIMLIRDKDKNIQPDVKIDNVFKFEAIVPSRVFNNVLVVTTKKGDMLFKYFDDIQYDPKYMTQTTFQNVLKYRKAFYDFIYKSKYELITGTMFYDLALSSLLGDIQYNEDWSETYRIKEKLNILFSLNKNFDHHNKNFGGFDMASKIPEYRQILIAMLSDGTDAHLASDEAFAFAAGQLIYYILYQSEASNKTHALLEPYISKSDPDLFKRMITRGIEQYKHALHFGHRKFQKLASEVLGYECKKSIKDLLPIVLAGYFSDCLLFEKS